jgi:HPt (histidine-containing phosphotransfer) domain-containing protein
MRLLAAVADGTDSSRGVPGPAPAGLLDPVALQELRNLDPTGAGRLMDRIVNAFEVAAARLLPQLQAAISTEDASAVRYAAHTLRSSSASIGAIRMSQLCAELEAAAARGWSEDMHEDIAALSHETMAVLNALKRSLTKAS